MYVLFHIRAGMYLPCRPRKTPAVLASPPMPVRARVLRGDIQTFTSFADMVRCIHGNLQFQAAPWQLNIAIENCHL